MEHAIVNSKSGKQVLITMLPTYSASIPDAIWDTRKDGPLPTDYEIGKMEAAQDENGNKILIKHANFLPAHNIAVILETAKNEATIAKQYLEDTDWMITRYVDETQLGMPPSLTQQELQDLLSKRIIARQKVNPYEV